MTRRKVQAGKAEFLVGLACGAALAAVVIGIILAVLLTRPIPILATPPQVTKHDVMVTYSEDYLTRGFTNLARSEDTIITGIQVDFQPGALADYRISAVLDILGVEVNLEATVSTQFQLDDGRIKIVPQKIQLGSIGIPMQSIPDLFRESVDYLFEEYSRGLNEVFSKAGWLPQGISTDETTWSVGAKVE